MKRREIVLALIGALLVLYGAKQIHRLPINIRQTTLGATCHTPVTIFQVPGTKPKSAVILFHGLSANRRVMSYLGEKFALAGFRVYMLDFPGHGDSAEPFTFARAEECATEAIGTLVRRGEIDPDKTALIGHSMGGAIAIRLADQFPTAATIAISPAPLVLPHRMPSNLLIFSAQFDLPLLKGAARQISSAAQGNRTQDSDFLERRAFELKQVAYATHSSLIVDWRVRDESLEWVVRGFTSGQTKPEAPGTVSFSFSELNHARHSSAGERAQTGALIGFLGLLLMLPLAASVIAAAFRVSGAGIPASASSATTNPEDLSHPATSTSLLHWTVASFISVCVMTLAVPLHPILRILTGDYLASLLLLVAAILWAPEWKRLKSAVIFNPRALSAALVLGFATFLSLGAWLNWQLTDAWLNGPRWWRFTIMIPLLVPYFFAEEITLGPSPESRAHRARRFGFFLALRFILWLACLFALVTTRNGQILILLMAVYMAAFSIFQRLGADALRRRTGSLPAAAVFDAILAAWFLAAVFPLT
jgi:pimeloyl-ACP methyl ester carboxylesterase